MFPAIDNTAEKEIIGIRQRVITSDATNTEAERMGSNEAALTDLQHVKSVNMIIGVSLFINNTMHSVTSVA